MKLRPQAPTLTDVEILHGHLDTILLNERWSHLAPLKELKPLYRWLREPGNRLRKAGAERLKDGSIAKNPQRMGPLTFEARKEGLRRVIDIQGRCNQEAMRLGRAKIDILNAEEVERISTLIMAQTWPDGWDGDEPIATMPMDTVYQDGSVQPLLVR